MGQSSVSDGVRRVWARARVGMGAATFCLLLSCGGPTTVVDDPTPNADGTTGAGDAGTFPTGQGAHLSPPAEAFVTSAAFSTDGETVVFRTVEHTFSFSTKTGEVSELATKQPEAAILLGGGKLELSMDGVPSLYSTDGLELLRFNDWQDAHVAASSDGGEVLMLGLGPSIGVWDLPNQAKSYQEGERVQDFLNRQSPVKELALPNSATALAVADSTRFGVAFDDGAKKGTLFTWDKDQPTDLTFVGRTNDTVERLAISPDETQMLAITKAGGLYIVSMTKQGFLGWTEKYKDVERGEWLSADTLLVHQQSGATTALTATEGRVLWSIKPDLRFERCVARNHKLACTNGKVLQLLDESDGSVVVEVAADLGSWIALSSGAFAGNAPASWVSGTLPGKSSPAKIAAALQEANL